MKGNFIPLRNFYAMKTWGRGGMCSYIFNVCASWRQGHFTSGERSSGTLWIRGWVGCWDSLEMAAKWMPRIEPRSANLCHEICRCCGSENKPCAQFPVLTSPYEHAYCRSNGMKTSCLWLRNETYRVPVALRSLLHQEAWTSVRPPVCEWQQTAAITCCRDDQVTRGSFPQRNRLGGQPVELQCCLTTLKLDSFHYKAIFFYFPLSVITWWACETVEHVKRWSVYYQFSHWIWKKEQPFDLVGTLALIARKAHTPGTL
jgi:hypothetical protein